MSVRITAFIACALLVFAALPRTARAEDPVRAKLDDAKEAYEAALEKYRATACEFFDRREKAAREKGDKKQVDQIKKERQAFEDKDELPNFAPDSIRRLFTKAKADMVAAYDAAVKDYTRDSKDSLADAVEKERDRFKKNEMGHRVDRFQAGTVWTGSLEGVGASSGKSATSSAQLKLTILDRDGERFKARYDVGTGTTRIIMGHVKGRRLWWTPEDVTVERGSSKGVDTFGYINGKQIQMRYFGTNEKGVAGFGVIELGLVENK
jgi:hypothetical protein